MAEILFGQSYYLRLDSKMWDAMQPYPPLGTLYAAAYLRERGHEVAVFDAVLAESEAQWQEALRQHRPRVAVLYEDSFNYVTKMCLLHMRQMALRMVDMARAAGCTVIVCGPDATDHPNEYFAHQADYVVAGEGEITLGELIDVLTGRSDSRAEDVAGIIYLHEGQPRATTPRPLIRALDSLPFPARDLVDLGRYQELWRRRHGYFSTNMVTTRGCPYRCNWCAKPIWGQHYATRSPENVVAELRLLEETLAPDHIWYADDIMGLEEGWIARLADLLDREGIGTPFKCLSRPDLILRDGVIGDLKRAGCQIVWIGAESGSQKVLDAMEKGIRVHDIVRASEELHRAGLQVGFFVQFGYPGETWEDIELTLQMLRQCRPDDIGISVSYPLPGTPLYEQVKDQLGSKQNWTDSSDLAMLYEGPFSTAFYRRLHRVVHKEQLVRRGWADVRRIGLQPRRFTARQLGRLATALYHSLTLPAARYDLRRAAR